MRLCCIYSMETFRQLKRNPDSVWLRKLPTMSKKLEAYLYYNAPSREIYLNVLTLKTRLRCAALEMAGDLPIICIDWNHVEREEECSICLDYFRTMMEVCKLRKCGHMYHKECIKPWIEMGHGTCPNCRGSFM